MNALTITGLCHTYGDQNALTSVSFSVAERELFCVLGPNGSGKSTLFKCLSTLLRPSRGEIWIDGSIDLLNDPMEARRHIGTVYQQPVLDPALSVRENLHISATLYGLSKAQAKERIKELAPVIGIDDRLDSTVKQLSGGLVRRADLLRGLLHDPTVLLLDEPTTGLDPAARHRFWHVIELIRERNRSTILFTSHLMEEAEGADRLMILGEGSIVAIGTSHGLREEAPGDRILIRSSKQPEITAWLREKFGVEILTSPGSIYFSVTDPDDVFRALHEAWDEDILELTIRKPSLEDIFFERTGTRWEALEDSQFGTEDQKA